MQTTKIFQTVFSTTVLLATLATASQAQLGCPFSKKSAGNTIFQKSLNINNANSITNPSLLQNKGIWLGAGAVGLLGAGSIALLLKKQAIANNLEQDLLAQDLNDHVNNDHSNTDSLYVTESNLDNNSTNNLNNLVVSHPEAPGGDLDVTTNLTYQEKAEEKVIALTK